MSKIQTCMANPGRISESPLPGLTLLLLRIVVSLAEIITNVDEVDLIMFNSISNPIQKSNKNNLDVVQLAAIVEVTSC